MTWTMHLKFQKMEATRSSRKGIRKFMICIKNSMTHLVWTTQYWQAALHAPLFCRLDTLTKYFAGVLIFELQIFQAVISVQKFLSFHLTFSSITVTLPNLFYLVFMVGKSGEIFKKQQMKILQKFTEKASKDRCVGISVTFKKNCFNFFIILDKKLGASNSWTENRVQGVQNRDAQSCLSVWNTDSCLFILCGASSVRNDKH